MKFRFFYSYFELAIKICLLLSILYKLSDDFQCIGLFLVGSGRDLLYEVDTLYNLKFI